MRTTSLFIVLSISIGLLHVSACSAIRRSNLNSTGSFSSAFSIQTLNANFNNHPSYKYSIEAKHFRNLTLAPAAVNRAAFITNNSLFVVNLENGETVFRKDFSESTSLLDHLTFSPSGNKLAYPFSTSMTADKKRADCIFIIDLATNSHSKCHLLDHAEKGRSIPGVVGGNVKAINWSYDESFLAVIADLYEKTNNRTSHTVLTTLHLPSDKSQTFFEKERVEVQDVGFTSDSSKIYVLTNNPSTKWGIDTLWESKTDKGTISDFTKMSVTLNRNYRGVYDLWVPNFKSRNLVLGGYGDAISLSLKDLKLNYVVSESGKGGGGAHGELQKINQGRQVVDLRNKGLWVKELQDEVTYLPNSEAKKAGIPFFQSGSGFGIIAVSPLRIIDMFGFSPAVEISSDSFKEMPIFQMRFDSDHKRWVALETQNVDNRAYMHVFKLN